MKKVLCAGILMAGTAGLFAQGQVQFNMDLTGSPNTLVTHVYSPNPGSPSVAQIGNSSVAYASPSARSGDFPQGTVAYGGVIIGGDSTSTGPAGFGNGNNFSAELFAASGLNASAGSLTAVASSLTTFHVNGFPNAGWINAITPAIPGIAPGTPATLEMVAWYNGGNTISFANSTINGASAPFNVSSLGGTDTAGNIFLVPALTGLTSFSLVNSVPEPSTIAMGVMGVCAFLARRRK